MSAGVGRRRCSRQLTAIYGRKGALQNGEKKREEAKQLTIVVVRELRLRNLTTNNKSNKYSESKETKKINGNISDGAKWSAL